MKETRSQAGKLWLTVARRKVGLDLTVCGALLLSLLAYPSQARAERVVFGRVTGLDGQGVSGLRVIAWDDDQNLQGNLPHDLNTHDLMGRAVTDANGYYRIDYPRPGGSGPGGGHWDSTPDHGLTIWRPDVFIVVDAPRNGFCTPARPTVDSDWRYVATSGVVYNHPMKNDLKLDLRVREAFDTTCGTFRPLRQWMQPIPGALRGIVDLHTHPMAHLAFGGRLLHGAPDLGSLMVPLSHNCNSHSFRTDRMGNALPRCGSTHTGQCPPASALGAMILMKAEEAQGAQSVHGPHSRGFSYFASWPRHNDITHQQMWIDWIYRAYRGGLRVIVALAVNNKTLGTALGGIHEMALEGRTVSLLDDVGSGRLQIEEIKGFVRRHAFFMEVAYTPADVRRIVGADKLAVVLGVELDDIGNLNGMATVTPAQVRAEVGRLHASGVRYVFPIHLVDNKFGGTAVYESALATANRYHFGQWWDMVCADPEDQITFKYQGSDFLMKVGAMATLGIWVGDTQPIPMQDGCNCAAGHVNRRPLHALGKVALKEMMRLGMMIDIDHMSQTVANQALSFAESYRYPVNSGHNGLRTTGRLGTGENTRTRLQYARIAALGGMAGIGWADTDAPGFLESFRRVSEAMRGRDLALGTDINGLVLGPRKPPYDNAVDYSQMPMARTGAKEWNYNAEGVAHYGLMPDFLVDLNGRGGSAELDVLFDGAEAFAKMWERADAVRDRQPTGASTDASDAPATGAAGPNRTAEGCCPRWVCCDAEPKPGRCVKCRRTRTECQGTNVP